MYTDGLLFAKVMSLSKSWKDHHCPCRAEVSSGSRVAVRAPSCQPQSQPAPEPPPSIAQFSSVHIWGEADTSLPLGSAGVRYSNSRFTDHHTQWHCSFSCSQRLMRKCKMHSTCGKRSDFLTHDPENERRPNLGARCLDMTLTRKTAVAAEKDGAR